MTSEDSLSPFILSLGVVAPGQVWLERVEADRAASSLSPLLRDKSRVFMQSVSVKRRTAGSESR